MGGRIEVTSTWPKGEGTELFAHSASVLPPVDAVFALGSETVNEWLRSLGWRREWRYNDSFLGKEVVREYVRLWETECPYFLESDTYAMLGGWHVPMADDDWHDLLDEQLLVYTTRDSEPWVEAWLMGTGTFKVIQRIT